MKTVLIKKGHSGIGDDMYLSRDTRMVILSLTGKTIDPVAKKLGEMLEMTVVNGFDAMPDDKKILCVVINCGGSLRCGIYPQKRIKTINVLPTGAMGPLAKYITEDIYISDVSLESLSLIETGRPCLCRGSRTRGGKTTRFRDQHRAGVDDAFCDGNR